ncbi:hypothetical protein RB195_005440 [Necator americanus]|uniref:Uncharacterized protein n=1 Tax=Necator americanus TaxID=51031 RepID=A0ABR1BMU2_NECAM
MTLQVCGLPAVSFQKIIEVVVRNEPRLTRDMVRHLNHVEERVLEELAWTRDSALWTSLSRKPDSVPTCDEAWGSMTRIVSSIGSPPKKMRYDSGSNTFSQVQFPPCNAQKSFFSKIYYLASVRLSDICERIRIDDRGRRMMWTVLEYILKEERSLFMDRHLDQNLLCIVYVVCKANKADVSFVDIMSHYRHQPQADSRIYRMVRVDSSVLLSNDTICSEEGSSRDSTSVTDSQPLRSRSSVGASPGASHSEEGSACAGKQLPTTPEPDPLTGQHVDLIVYYNKVFLPRVEEFMKKISDNCPLASLTPMPVRRLPRSAPSKRNLSDKTWAAPSTVMEKLDERKLLRRLLGYFRPRKVAKVNRLRFFGHILRRPADRLVQRVLKSSSGSSWKKPPGRKRKFWTVAVKEDLRTLAVDRQFRRDVRFRRIWNSDEWIDSVEALAEDREGWAELCSRTAHLGEDAGNRVRHHQPAD